MDLIKPIELICNKNKVNILKEDLQKLCDFLNFDLKGYKITDFIYPEPSNDDREILRFRKQYQAFCLWDTVKPKCQIFFPEAYFDLNNEKRSSIFFHEICHFIIYSGNKESKKIIQLKEKINKKIYKNKDNKKLATPELIAKDEYIYVLSLFNEYLVDELMLTLNQKFYSLKFEECLFKKYSRELHDLDCSLDYLYICFLDVLRSIELVKGIKELSYEYFQLKELSECFEKKLENKTDRAKVQILMKYKDKLIDSYIQKDSELTKKVFDELILDLL